MYTIGFIGPHKVVSTKLPAVGRQMAAQISSGNTTTRLLGMSCFISVMVILLDMKDDLCRWLRSTTAAYVFVKCC